MQNSAPNFSSARQEMFPVPSKFARNYWAFCACVRLQLFEMIQSEQWHSVSDNCFFSSGNFFILNGQRKRLKRGRVWALFLTALSVRFEFEEDEFVSLILGQVKDSPNIFQLRFSTFTCGFGLLQKYVANRSWLTKFLQVTRPQFFAFYAQLEISFKFIVAIGRERLEKSNVLSELKIENAAHVLLI